MTTPPPAQPPSTSSLSTFSEGMDANAAATLRLCSEQPNQKYVRKALLDVEKDVHVNGGWDSPPQLFVLEQNTRNHRISYRPQRRLTALVQKIVHHNDGMRHPDILEAVANNMEHARRHANGVAPHPTPSQPAEKIILDLIYDLMPSHVTTGGDLLAAAPGNRFHGIGFLSESWMVSPEQDENIKDYYEQARQHTLYTRPKRLEVRQIHYSARDGLSWEVMRVRRVPDVALPRYCFAHTHESDKRWEGTIPEIMSRMCNAIASNPVPVRHCPSEDELPL